MASDFTEATPPRHAAPSWRNDNAPTDATAKKIGDLAYRYWVERQKNHTPGSDIGDWLRAEGELIRLREAGIDEASEESFPASDAPAR